MSYITIQPPGAKIPGVSQATRVDSGPLLLLSGHVPLLEDGRVAGVTLEEQLEQVYYNLEQTLRAAGTSFSNVAKLNIFVCNLDSSMLEVIRNVRNRFIDTSRPPASSLVGVSSLFHPEVLVEIEAIATLG